MAYKKHPNCVSGHEFTAENTYIMPNGARSCKICRLNRTLEYIARNREKINTKHRLNRKFGTLCPSDTPEGKRRARLRRLGWTPEKFDKAVKEQNGKCDICKKTLTFGRRSNALACADHKHSDVPKPRGVLCINCNLGIGNLQENIEILLEAVAYLEKWKEG